MIMIDLESKHGFPSKIVVVLLVLNRRIQLARDNGQVDDRDSCCLIEIRRHMRRLILPRRRILQDFAYQFFTHQLILLNIPPIFLDSGSLGRIRPGR